LHTRKTASCLTAAYAAVDPERLAPCAASDGFQLHNCLTTPSVTRILLLQNAVMNLTTCPSWLSEDPFVLVGCAAIFVCVAVCGCKCVGAGGQGVAVADRHGVAWPRPPSRLPLTASADDTGQTLTHVCTHTHTHTHTHTTHTHTGAQHHHLQRPPRPAHGV
jgi:hypothetical protein